MNRGMIKKIILVFLFSVLFILIGISPNHYIFAESVQLDRNNLSSAIEMSQKLVHPQFNKEKNDSSGQHNRGETGIKSVTEGKTPVTATTRNDKLNVQGITDKTTKIKGTATPYSTVTATVDHNVIGTTTLNKDNKFELSIPTQKEYTVVTLQETYTDGNTSDLITLTVKPSYNLVIDKPAKASSTWSNQSTYDANKALDGDDKTRWSAFKELTPWLVIDFGENTVFDQVEINEYSSRVQEFKLQYWNGKEWVDAYKGKNIGAKFTATFEPVTGSKVRLNVTASTNEPSIWEFGVYNTTNPPNRKVSDEEILELESKKSFEFFWNEANTDKNSPGYGLIRDRAPGNPNTSSIASVGFGLSALAIGAERGWISRSEAEERTLGTLKNLLNNVNQKNGFFYHFLDMKTGKRAGKSELSTIDTMLLLNGAIVSGEYFGGEAKNIAAKIYDRVDWRWFHKSENNKFIMSWTPEAGFSKNDWAGYSEQLGMYVLGAGSKTYPVGGDMFYDFTRAKKAYKDGTPFIYSWKNPLFIHQYSHAWIDFRNTVDKKGINWFKNSILASQASRQYSIDMANKYKTLGENAWGLTASDSPDNYKISGSPPSGRSDGPSDTHSTNGTLAPAGAAGSIVFTPKETIAALKNYYENYPHLWGKYGFKDAYNLDVTPSWYAQDVIGIDKGITLLMIENYRSGFVWKYFMKNEAVRKGMEEISLKNEKAVEDLQNVSAKWEDETVRISWEKANDHLQQSDYEYIYIYDQNGKEIAGPISINESKLYYDIKKLKNGNEYIFNVIREKNGVKSKGVMVKGSPIADVQNLEENKKSNINIFQADKWSKQSGNLQVEKKLSPDFTSVGNVKKGDWLRYDNINFGDGQFDMFMATISSLDANKTIEIRLDSPQGNLIGTLNVQETNNKSIFKENYASISKITGMHSIYLVFPNDMNCSINWFALGKDVSIETEEQKGERMDWFNKARFGQFIHWGAYSKLGGVYNGRNYRPAEWIMNSAKISKDDYIKKATSLFNPEDYDPKEWVAMMKEAGQKYFVITTKHHDGFSMYNTNVNGFKTYDIVNSSTYGEDPLKKLAKESKKQGIKFGIYYSILDWVNENALGSEEDSLKKELYLTQMKEQLRELIENYDPDILWFDGNWYKWLEEKEISEGLYKYLRTIKPDLIINNRLGNGVGDFITAEQYIPGSSSSKPWETAMTMNGTWGYATHDHNWKSTKTIISHLVEVASKGGNFLLNVGPTGEGKIPEPSVERLREVGKWLDVNGESIYGTKGNILIEDSDWGYSTTTEGKVYLHIINWPTSKELEIPMPKNHINNIYLLNKSDSSLQYHIKDGKIIIALPEHAPDPYDSVIAIAVDGEPKPLEYENLALNKQVTASSTWNNEKNYQPEKLVDGNHSTRWSASGNEKDNWVEIDFGKVTTFNKVNIREFIMPDSRVEQFSLQYWDGEQWIDIHKGTKVGGNKSIEFPNVKGSKVRLNMTAKNDEAISIYEFQVHNTKKSSNLALHKPAKASSVWWNQSEHDASKATDEDSGTRWAPFRELTPWLEVDFEEEIIFNQVKLDEYINNNEAYTRVQSFKIQYWNGKEWLDAYSGGKIGKDFEANFKEVKGSKVRLSVLSAKNEPSICAFKVYNVLKQ